MSKPCKFCNADINWGKDQGKFVPLNLDGTRHNCRSQNGPAKSNGPNLSPELEGRMRQIAREVARQVLEEFMEESK